jgi:hypothetical protein
MIVSTELFLEWEIFPIEDVEKIKTHVLYSVTFLKKFVMYKIMLKNMVEMDRSQIAIWYMQFVCQISKATDTLQMCST